MSIKSCFPHFTSLIFHSSVLKHTLGYSIKTSHFSSAHFLKRSFSVSPPSHSLTSNIIKLIITSKEYSIYRLSNQDLKKFNFNDLSKEFCTFTKTDDEISFITESHLIKNFEKEENGWRLLKLDGVIPFTESGILLSIIEPLAKAKISVLTISTFNTDYVFFKKENTSLAVDALKKTNKFSIKIQNEIPHE